jgi:hypothetical protein
MSLTRRWRKNPRREQPHVLDVHDIKIIHSQLIERTTSIQSLRTKLATCCKKVRLGDGAASSEDLGGYLNIVIVTSSAESLSSTTVLWPCGWVVEECELDDEVTELEWEKQEP